MTVTPDTNILVRVAVQDDPTQARAAAKLLEEADFIAVSPMSLCEFAWVLHRAYGFNSREIADAVKRLIEADNVRVVQSAIESGLAMLDGGGDFADGLIAYEGRWLGGEVFVSFDRKAVALLSAQGHKAELLP